MFFIWTGEQSLIFSFELSICCCRGSCPSWVKTGLSLWRTMKQMRDGQIEGLNAFLLLATQGKNILQTGSSQSVLAVVQLRWQWQGPKTCDNDWRSVHNTTSHLATSKYHSRSRSSWKELVLCLGYSRINFGSLFSLSLLLSLLVLASVSCQCGVYVIKPS